MQPNLDNARPSHEHGLSSRDASLHRPCLAVVRLARSQHRLWILLAERSADKVIYLRASSSFRAAVAANRFDPRPKLPCNSQPASSNVASSDSVSRVARRPLHLVMNKSMQQPTKQLSVSLHIYFIPALSHWASCDQAAAAAAAAAQSGAIECSAAAAATLHMLPPSLELPPITFCRSPERAADAPYRRNLQPLLPRRQSSCVMRQLRTVFGWRIGGEGAAAGQSRVMFVYKQAAVDRGGWMRWWEPWRLAARRQRLKSNY